MTAEQPAPVAAAIVASAEPATTLEKRTDHRREGLEKLDFFGLKPDMNVVELWPSDTQLAKLLTQMQKGRGNYYAALEYEVDGSSNQKSAISRNGEFTKELNDDPALNTLTKTTVFGPGTRLSVPRISPDMIIGHQIFHLWMRQGFAEEALVDCFRALKPGGILALEDNRGNRDVEQDPKAADGYVNQYYVIGQAELAGFKFVGSSELEANPRDTANWPRGVFALAPAFALGDQDRAKYEAIGLPDKFLLKFQKPDAPAAAPATTPAPNSIPAKKVATWIVHPDGTAIYDGAPPLRKPPAILDENSAEATERSFGLQLAASPSEIEARAAFERLKAKSPSLLGSLSATVRRSDITGKSVFRVRIENMTHDEAFSLCDQMIKAALSCFVVHL